MGGRILGGLVALALLTDPARAETLGDLLRARGVTPPGGVPHLDRPVRAHTTLDDDRDVLVVYAVGDRDAAPLHAVRFERAPRRWAAARLDRSAAAGLGAPDSLEASACRTQLAIARFPGGFLVRSHINPSAECTLVLGPDLAVRGILAGWPVATLADGRIVFQRNQVHFASFHPVALALFDPPRRAEIGLYPRRPYGPSRLAHMARMRAVYSDAWCSAHNHPCDPDLFDEHVSGEVLADGRADTLAFVTAWDNTTGWSVVERWGRLEAFRELRAALARWDGQGAPPAELYRGLAAGLGRARSMGAEGHVAAALADDPVLVELVRAALAGRPAAGQDARSWLVSLDGRWAEGRTWQSLGRAVSVPDEFTEVVHVYSGLRRPETMRHRELLRRDFEARFGPGAPRRALEPDVVRELFPTTGP
jgi:hypothetical protein